MPRPMNSFATLTLVMNPVRVPESGRLCRVALANYFAAALLMPYDEFRRCAIEMRYDVVPDPDVAIASLDAPNDNGRVAGWIRRFLEA